jgi:membrane protein DedA with SNARE-associated domain
MLKSAGVRWALVGVLITIIVLVPFMVWDEQITGWVLEFRQSAQEKWLLTTGVVIGLLAADIVAPIPNSILATASGYILRFVGGTLASTAGMVLNCVIGYWIGLRAGRPTIGRFVGDLELSRLERLTARFGYWAVALTRGLPVLGEAALIFAGMSRMPWWRFLVVSVLSSLGLSAVYAATGAFVGEVEGNFAYAFLASNGIAALGMLIMSRVENRTANTDDAVDA